MNTDHASYILPRSQPWGSPLDYLLHLSQRKNLEVYASVRLDSQRSAVCRNSYRRKNSPWPSSFPCPKDDGVLSPRNNVRSVVQSSANGFLMFSCTPVHIFAGILGRIWIFYDLPPYLPTRMRATILEVKDQALRANGAKVSSTWWWRQEDNDWPLIHCFHHTLTWVVMSYAPAGFLQHLVRCFQHDPDHSNNRWSWFPLHFRVNYS